MNNYASYLAEHHRVSQALFDAYHEMFAQCGAVMHHVMSTGGRILLCGNGGSACDAMHIAGEFVGRFKAERRGLPAIALSADSGILTAIGNDYGFEHIFTRQVEALGREGDVLLALSTSGQSPNILAALSAARAQHMHTVLFTGLKGRDAAAACEYGIVIDSTDTAIIQECSMMVLHRLAGHVETLSMAA